MSFHPIIPDPESLLSLEPEELAGPVLEYLNSAPESELNRRNFSLPHIVKGYPDEYKEKISKAILKSVIMLSILSFTSPPHYSYTFQWHNLNQSIFFEFL
jgi:hypothetical protein